MVDGRCVAQYLLEMKCSLRPPTAILPFQYRPVSSITFNVFKFFSSFLHPWIVKRLNQCFIIHFVLEEFSLCMQ